MYCLLCAVHCQEKGVPFNVFGVLCNGHDFQCSATGVLCRVFRILYNVHDVLCMVVYGDVLINVLMLSTMHILLSTIFCYVFCRVFDVPYHVLDVLCVVCDVECRVC